MEISIIIVTFNTADLIGSCLDSLLAEKDLEMEIVVVDNASQDGSVDLVHKRYPDIKVIANNTNKGFGAANNQALSFCKGRYIFFLNPDTVLRSGTLRRSIDFMDKNPQIGLAGTKMVNPDGSDQESVSYRYPGEKYTTGELDGLKGRISCVLGAAMIARTDLVQKIGGFDEDFFLYGEDQDLCLRIRKSGYEIGYIESAVVVHLGGQSERKSTTAELWIKKNRAEYLFYRKHYRETTITRILNFERWKSLWRIATLKLTIPFTMHKKEAKEKLIRYQVIYDEIKRAGK